MRQSLNKRPSVLIGKDTRLSGYVIEAALQAGFNAAGVDVHMLGPLPTPAIAHLVKAFMRIWAWSFQHRIIHIKITA